MHISQPRSQHSPGTGGFGGIGLGGADVSGDEIVTGSGCSNRLEDMGIHFIPVKVIKSGNALRNVATCPEVGKLLHTPLAVYSHAGRRRSIAKISAFIVDPLRASRVRESEYHRLIAGVKIAFPRTPIDSTAGQIGLIKARVCHLMVNIVNYQYCKVIQCAQSEDQNDLNYWSKIINKISLLKII